MLIVPGDDDAMDADADEEDYIPDAGGEVGTSSQVCGNGGQARVPHSRASGRGWGTAKAGVPVQGGTRPGRAGTQMLEMTFQHLSQTRPPGVHFDQPTL